MVAASMASRDFSGVWPEGARIPEAMTTRSKVPSSVLNAASTLAGSVMSNPFCLRDKGVTLSPRACNAATRAAPMPPEAPTTRDLFVSMTAEVKRGAPPATKGLAIAALGG